jgi:hypothetical protein
MTFFTRTLAPILLTGEDINEATPLFASSSRLGYPAFSCCTTTSSTLAIPTDPFGAMLSVAS